MKDTLTMVLFNLEKVNWLFDIVSLIILTYAARKSKKISSSLITLAVIVTVSAIMVFYQPYLLALKNKVNYQALLFSWYIGFAIIDMLAIFAIFLPHKYYKMPFGTLANFTLFALFSLAFLQLIRYIERLKFGSDILQPLYRYGVMAINSSVTALTIILALLAMFSIYQLKIGKRIVKWTI